MSFISFAQNFEDMMLWRTLEHVQYGFYIDIEDRHPVVNSVSKAFYENGWRGIHIEPVPALAKLLRRGRPNETVLQVALAYAEGMLELDVVQDKGLSATVEVYAQHHQDERYSESQQVHLSVLLLRSALKLLESREVHCTYVKKIWRITWLLRRLMQITRIMKWGYSHA